MKINVIYELSEAGQRSAIRAGADAAQKQRFEIDDPGCLLVNDVVVRADGSAFIMLDDRAPRVAVNTPWAYSAPKNKRTARVSEGDRVLFDERITTLAQVSEAVAAQRARLAEAKAACAVCQAELDAEYAEAIAACEKAREAQAAKNAAERAKVEAREAERSAWVEAHGSSLLRRKLSAGYDCQSAYIAERLAAEFPGYAATPLEQLKTRSRAVPTDTGFEEAERVGGTVLWLVDVEDRQTAEDLGIAHEWHTDATKLDNQHEIIVKRGWVDGLCVCRLTETLPGYPQSAPGPRKTPIVIRYFTGNLVCGNDMPDIDCLATLNAYEAQVRAALSGDYEVRFERQAGEGPAEKLYSDEEGFDAEQHIDGVLDAVERVFETGTFWRFTK